MLERNRWNFLINKLIVFFLIFCLFSIAFSNFSFGNKNVIKDYISNDFYSFEKIGVLMINYGEPELFEEDTYGDFKVYMNFMMNIGMIPSFFKIY